MQSSNTINKVMQLNDYYFSMSSWLVDSGVGLLRPPPPKKKPLDLDLNLFDPFPCNVDLGLNCEVDSFVASVCVRLLMPQLLFWVIYK